MSGLASSDRHLRRVAIAAIRKPHSCILIGLGFEESINRKSSYRLVDLNVNHEDWFGAIFFGIIPLDEMERISNLLLIKRRLSKSIKDSWRIFNTPIQFLHLGANRHFFYRTNALKP